MLYMPGLRLQTATIRDMCITSAAASDPQAQRWLGWQAQDLIPERGRERLLAMPPGQGRIMSPRPGKWFLAAIDEADGRLAGAIGADEDSGEVGGWLAPRFRGRGLGASLFAGAAEFAHQHLGVPSVIAATEPGNAACIGALVSAGFSPATGPDTHPLPNGRVVFVHWFRHESTQPTTCEAWGPTETPRWRARPSTGRGLAAGRSRRRGASPRG